MRIKKEKALKRVFPQISLIELPRRISQMELQIGFLFTLSSGKCTCKICDNLSAERNW